MFNVTLQSAEDGWMSQGKNENDALENITEAIRAWLWAEDQKAVAGLSKHAGQQQIVVSV